MMACFHVDTPSCFRMQQPMWKINPSSLLTVRKGGLSRCLLSV